MSDKKNAGVAASYITSAMEAFSRMPVTRQEKMMRQFGIISRADLYTIEMDDEVVTALGYRRAGLEGIPLVLAPDVGPNFEAVQRFMDEFAATILVNAQDARWYGRTVMEALWIEPEDHEDGIYYPSQIRRNPFNLYRWDKGVLKCFPRNNPLGVDVFGTAPGMFQHFITFHRRSLEQPDGEAHFVPLFWYWFIKTGVLPMWPKAVEAFGSPSLKVSSNTADPEKLEEIAATIAMLKASGVIATHKDNEVGVLNQPNKSFPHHQLLSHCDRKIQRLILGNNLVTEIDGGSHAAANAAMKVAYHLILGDLKLCLPTLQRILDTFCFLNEFETYKVSAVLPEDLRLELAVRDGLLVDQGASFTPEYFQEKYGFEPHHLHTSDGSPPPVAMSRRLFGRGRRSPLDADLIRHTLAGASGPREAADRLAALVKPDNVKEWANDMEQVIRAGFGSGYLSLDG